MAEAALTEARVPPFRAAGLHVGGLYPFCYDPNGLVSPGAIEMPGMLASHFPRKGHLGRLRKQVYDPDERWTRDEWLFGGSARIPELTLSSGRQLTDLQLELFAWIYPHGFGVLSFWVDCGPGEFSVGEVTELTALARGSKERIDQQREALRRKADFLVRFPSEVVECHELRDLCRYVDTRIVRGHLHSRSLTPQFIFPLVSIENVIGCQDCQEIRQLFGTQVVSIAEVWREFETDWLKPQDVDAVLATDFHPFQYAMSCVSSGCAVELHGSSSRQAAYQYALEPEEHYRQEREYLLLQCELPVLQLFAMRLYDRRLAALQEDLDHSRYKWAWSPGYLVRLLFEAIRLRRLHGGIGRSVAALRDRYFGQKSYVHRASTALRAVFGTAEIERSVDRRISGMRDQINMIFSMITALLALGLTFLATILGVLAAVQAFTGTDPR